MSKEELNQLDKSELVDLIYDYWTQLKTQADNGMSDKESYMMEEFGRVKMTEVNKLRNMLHHILNQKKMSKNIALQRHVSRMLADVGFDKLLKAVNDTILEKQYSSTQTYWKEFKEELLNQNKDE